MDEVVSETEEEPTSVNDGLAERRSDSFYIL
jgi:hypothetical protein